MSDDLDDFNFAAALPQPMAARALPGQTLKGRRGREKQKLSAADRNMIRRTGRTEQMNFKVRLAMKTEITRYAEDHDLMLVEVIERAWNAYKQRSAT